MGRDCRLTPDINTSTCIFYPVKEEEREVPLGPCQTSSGTDTSNNLLQTERHAGSSNCGESLHFYLQLNVLKKHPLFHRLTAEERSRFAEDYQRKSRGPLPEPGPADISEGQGFFFSFFFLLKVAKTFQKVCPGLNNPSVSAHFSCCRDPVATASRSSGLPRPEFR